MQRVMVLGMLLIGVGACGRPLTSTSVPRLSPGMTEDQIFDATRQPPATLLRQLYEDHQLLVLAFAEHNNERQYRALTTLLDQVGRDPRLKYIVLERFAEHAPVLEAASVAGLDELQLAQELRRHAPILRSGPDTATNHMKEFCFQTDEWLFSWAKVMPHIRAVNASRPAANTLLVTSVDEAAASLRGQKRIESYERDSMTAALFQDRIWRELKRDEAAKAIVVYHIGHTIQGFLTARGSRTTSPTFLGIFLQDHPEARARTALVMIDGEGTGKEPTHEFRFTKRQVTRAARQPFGVRTAPFRGVTQERGDSVFTPNAQLSSRRLARRDRALNSPATLSEMVDAVVWLPESEQQPIKEGRTYFPTACARGR